MQAIANVFWQLVDLGVFTMANGSKDDSTALIMNPLHVHAFPCGHKARMKICMRYKANGGTGADKCCD
ncbi:hypothetical protein Y1Q_0023410 [Alligator mississippiensis]|uniref:Uncharacterized protein n=1 Tax=Alligator mississippiensis TaxID=8496 RepID=A0A151NPE1_ALLMI|nr:hypothetical protein Y1Q_0023410 [Alligator mississippiensis]